MFRYPAFLPPCFLPDVSAPAALAHDMTAATLTLAGQLQHLYADVAANCLHGLAQPWYPAPPASIAPVRWAELTLVLEAAPERQAGGHPDRPFHDAARAILADQARAVRGLAIAAPRPASANDN